MPCEACLQPFELTKRPSDKELRATLRVPLVPYGAEVETIQEKIADAYLELERLEEEIARTLARAKRLKSQRQSIQSFIALKEAVSAPIRRLPTEILLEIFLIVSPNVTITTTSGFPWQLAHVCSHWKEVVLSSPELWSSICLGFPNQRMSKNGVMKASKGLDLCLTRSREHPLSIHLWAYKKNMAITRDVIKIALQVQAHWKKLKYLGEEFVDSDGFVPPMLHLPKLQNLSLYPPRNALSILSPDVNPLELLSPPELFVQTLSQAWPRITRLRLSLRIEVHDFASILLKLEELLELDIIHVHLIGHTDGSHIVSHHNGILVLKVALGNPIINHLDAPNLQTLFIENGHASAFSNRFSSGEIVADFLERSCCSITRLILVGWSFPIGDLLEIIRWTPDVGHLDLLISQRSSIWEHLMYKGDLPLLHRLQILNLGVVVFTEFSDVVQIVKSRADPPSDLEGHHAFLDLATEGRLRNLSLQFYRYLRNDEQRLVVQLLEQLQGFGGLKVDLEGDLCPIVIF